MTISKHVGWHRSTLRSLTLTGLAAACCLAAGTSFADSGAGNENGNGSHGWTNNPNHPAYDHPYRHGAIPTVEGKQNIDNWNNEFFHQGASTAQPTSSAGQLSYGGAVSGVGVGSGQVKVYLVFYGTQWGTQSTDSNGNLAFTGDSYGAASAVQQMFKGIGTNGETWQADLTQWCDGPNVSSGATSCPSNANFVPYQQNVFAGAWYDNSAASPSSATGTQLAQEAIKAAAHFGNTATGSNRFTYYIILSPHGTNPDNYQSPTQGYCAWHDYTGDGYGVTAPGGDLAFSNQPYNMDLGTSCGVGFVNGSTNGKLDGYTMTLGHEWHEMMSDMFPAGGWTNHSSGTYSGQENSDECAWLAPGTAGGAANITFSTGTFAEQASWSNDTGACSISHAILTHGGGGTPAASFSFTTNGLAANFTDSSTDSGGTISTHAWTFGDGGTSTATNPSHTYASAGTYSVSETVTDSVSGATNTATKSVTVASSGGTPTANFSFTTSGLTATFTDSSTDSGGTIASHSWNFGDSSTSTAVNPSHTYAASGTYTVTETVTDSGGATNSTSKSVTVSSGSTCTPSGTVLCSGSTVTGLAASTGNWTSTYTIVIPSGATKLTVAITGSSGDADLYVRKGSAPTTSSYTCRPYLTGDNETCTINSPTVGATYYIRLRAYQTFSGVTLKTTIQ